MCPTEQEILDLIKKIEELEIQKQELEEENDALQHEIDMLNEVY